MKEGFFGGPAEVRGYAEGVARRIRIFTCRDEVQELTTEVITPEAVINELPTFNLLLELPITGGWSLFLWSTVQRPRSS